jgi:hypothetical protein
MGYWSIVIEGIGAHHNPDFAGDANRLADDLVLRLKAAGADIKRAAFLFDYKGDDAGDTLPYIVKPWPAERISTEVEGDPYSVMRIPNGDGIHHFRLAYKGQIEKRGYWHTDLKYVEGVAKQNNEAAARLKPVGGGSSDDEPTEPEPTHVLVDEDDGRITKYWWHPAEGVVYRARAEGGAREPFEWSETYDLDLGSEVYLRWTWGVQDGHDDLPYKDRPRTEKPIGAQLHWPDEGSPSHIGGGGITFSSAPENYRVHVNSVTGEKREYPTWDVQSWAPLTVTPSILTHGHQTRTGHTTDKHGFIRYGRWEPA